MHAYYRVPPFVFIGQGRYTLMFLLSSEIADDSRSRAKTRCGKTRARLKVTIDFVAHGCLRKDLTHWSFVGKVYMANYDIDIRKRYIYTLTNISVKFHHTHVIK